MIRRSTLATLLAVGSLAAWPLAAQSETPNVHPGQWEYTSTTVMEGSFNMPAQTSTHTECVTAEDIQRAEDLMEVPEECQLENADLRADGMDYTFVCSDPSGARMRMDGSMQFMGDRTEGQMRSEMDSPMGPMTMRIDLKGERIGDC